MRCLPRTWHGRMGAVLALGALLGQLVLYPGPRPVGADENVLVRESVTLVGRGFGHGRGMSQYGAFRAGSLGVSSTAITDRYYAGSSLGTIGNPLYRVQVGSAERDSSVLFPSVPGLTVRDEATGVERRIDTVAPLWRVVTDASGLHVQHLDEETGWTSIGIGATVSFQGTVRVFTNQSPTMSLRDEASTAVRGYRGNFRVHRLNSTQLSLVNVVLLEDYLRSVVPSEVPSSWPTRSLEAQAIAARSYAGWYYQNPRAAHYDICDSTACQVYSGSDKERPTTDAAVAATTGKARKLGTSILRAEFSSSNGGWAAEGGAGHGGPGYDDWSDGPWDPSHEWRVTLTDTDLGSMVGAGFRLQRMVILERDGVGDWGGRVKSVRLYAVSPSGTLHTADVTGDDIRRRFGLRSTLFTVVGSPEAVWIQMNAQSTNARAITTHTYGPASSYRLLGDWDGDGASTPAVLTAQSGEWRWRMSNGFEITSPSADFRYGPTWCRPIAGDWNGDGVDTPGLACPTAQGMRWRLSNVNGTSAPAVDFTKGPADGRPVVGRWSTAMASDGVGMVTTGATELEWQVFADLSPSSSTASFSYGARTDKPVVGDWDGSGTSGVGIVRPSDGRWTWKVRLSATAGSPDRTFLLGLTSQGTLVAEVDSAQARPVLTG